MILMNRRDKKTKKTYWGSSLNNDEVEVLDDPVLREFWEESKKGRFISKEEVRRFGKELQRKYPEADIRLLLMKMTTPEDYISSWMSIASEEEIRRLMKEHYDKYWHEEYEREEIEEMY